jgi:hypothetical protein
MSDIYVQASLVLQKHRDKIMALPGVHGIGVGRSSDYGGEDTPCLVIYLDKTADGSQVPERIEGYPVYRIRSERFLAQSDVS